jgi:hypothetical protein
VCSYLMFPPINTRMGLHESSDCCFDMLGQFRPDRHNLSHVWRELPNPHFSRVSAFGCQLGCQLALSGFINLCISRGYAILPAVL